MSYFNWDALNETWNGTHEYWWAIYRKGHATPEEAYENYQKLDKRKKRKVLQLIMQLKGQEFSQQREVRTDIEVTIDDIELLRKAIQKQMTVEVMDVEVW